MPCGAAVVIQSILILDVQNIQGSCGCDEKSRSWKTKRERKKGGIIHIKMTGANQLIGSYCSTPSSWKRHPVPHNPWHSQTVLNYLDKFDYTYP
jgi:hypothetical protein